jgi:hypothetical protein
MASLKDIAPRYLYTDRLTLELYDHGPEQQACFLSALNSKTTHERMGDYGIRTPEQLEALLRSALLKNPIFKDGIADSCADYVLHLGAHCPDGKLLGGVSLAQRQVGDVILPPDIGWVLMDHRVG